MKSKSAFRLLALLVLIVGLGVSLNIVRERQTAPQASTISSANPFGIMTWGNSDQTKIKVANNLGAYYYRPLAIVLNTWQGSCSECDLASSAGLKLILTVRNSSSTNPPANLNSYRIKLTQVVNKYSPEVLVIENEENSNLFYSGTPQQYLDELKVGCEVAHSQHIKCTNGGLVSQLVESLASGALPKTPKERDQIARGKALLAGYKSSGADFVNFHWYVSDPNKLSQAVEYLQSASGLPAMTNEVGQQGNTDPQQVTSIMQKIIDMDLPYAVWFSMDTGQGGDAMALTNITGILRDNGRAFQQFTRSFQRSR